MDEYLQPRKNADEDEKLSALALYLKGSILDQWFEKRPWIQTWAEAKGALWN